MDSKKSIKKTKRVSKKPVISREYIKIDAEGKAIGRLAVEIAKSLMGKTKPTFQYHVDNGDFVMVANLTKVKFTGKKYDQKEYYHHSGYPGGLKTTLLKQIFPKNPEKILHDAVWNMLPKNKLRAQMIKRLKISK